MRRLAAIFISLILCVPGLVAQVDSTKLAELDSRLERYFSLLDAEDFGTKITECDALIEAATDPSLRQRIALKIYDHYLNSKLMGDEAVAIHLTDKWFSTGEVAMGSDQALLDAKLFADFNRQSLIGMPAPKVTLHNPFGEEVSVPEPVEGRFQVIYFFDTDCAKCKLETAMLRNMLDDKDYPVDVSAVYVGHDMDSWKIWRGSTFVLNKGNTRIRHLWDPDDESDYQMKYGVTVTPRMFLVDPDGFIVGRGLDTGALASLLDIYLDDGIYKYGKEESSVLLDEVFSVYGAKVGSSDVMEVASLLSDRTLAKGDTLGFKHMEGDLLYYLATKRGEGFKEGTRLFVKDYILSRPEIWNTPDDSLAIVGMASMFDGLLSKAPVGAKVPKTPIKGWNKLRRKGGFFLFSSQGCPVCAAEKAAADYLHLAYLPVEMESLERESPELARKMLDFFDLSSLPYIIQVGKRGVIKRRYISLSEHLLFLSEKD